MHAGVRNIRFQRQNGLFPPVYTDFELQSVKMPVLLLAGDKERVLDSANAMKGPEDWYLILLLKSFLTQAMRSP